jgi:PEP-CTERM motif
LRTSRESGQKYGELFSEYLEGHMRNVIGFGICALALAAATPATATVTLSLGAGGAAVTGGRTFTAGTGSEAVNVRVSAWSISGATTSNSSTISLATLGQHGASGLGVLFSGETNSGNQHTIDNKGRTDFIMLQFDKTVWLSNATFNAFKLDSNTYTDTDATVGYGTTNLAWNTAPTLTNITSLNALIPSAQRYGSGNNGTQGTNTRNIDPLNYKGNVWIISSAWSQHNPDATFKNDAFKLNNILYTTRMPVPEPATWMMMIAGFGMIGGAIRRRRALDTLATA